MAEEKKTLYHGEFRSLGPVAVKVLSEPQPSVKQKGKFFVKLEIGGRMRYLHPENEACLEFWRGKNGQEFTVVAEGEREQATLTYVGKSGSTVKKPVAKPAASSAAASSPEPAPKPPPAPPRASRPATAPRQQAAATDAESPLQHCKRYVARNASLAKVALKAAYAIKDEVETVTPQVMSNELFVAVFTSLLFGANGAGCTVGIPMDLDYTTLEKRVKP